MSITKERKQALIGDHRRAGTDTGSPEVQVAILTARISELTGHLRTHGKDFASRRGLLAMVSRRRRLLDYLKKVDPQKHLEGAGIFILGTTRDCVFEHNTIHNRNGLQKRGIYVGPQVINPTFSANDVSGHDPDVDIADTGVG